MKNRIAILFVLVACMATANVGLVRAQPVGECVTSFGVKVPVVLVHGLNGDADTWGERENSQSMIAAVSRIDSVAVDGFNYPQVSTEWVTNESIGPKLVRRIDCLAQTSLQNGGKGKVIVLAHSMGGLAAQYALNQTVEGRKVADAVGLVITIGTPYLGSGLAGLCQEFAKMNLHPSSCSGSAITALAAGSKELRDLPVFPAGVPVKAVAGDVTVNMHILTHRVKIPMLSDLVVPKASASGYSTSVGVGDGTRTFACEGSVGIPGISDAPCEHSNLLTMPDVQNEVKASIEQYLASRVAPPSYFFGLGLALDKNWRVAVTPAAGAQQATIEYNLGKPCRQTECPFLMFYHQTLPEGKVVDGKYTDSNRCPGGGSAFGPAQWKQDMFVGKEAAGYYESPPCPGGTRTRKLWFVPSRSMLILGLPSSQDDQHVPKRVMDQLFASALWQR